MGLFSKKSSTPVAPKQPQQQQPAKAAPQPAPAASRPVSTIPPPAPAAAALNVKLPSKPNADADPVTYLKSLYAIRERSDIVFGKRKQLKHFQYNEMALQNVVRFVLSILKRDYGTDYRSIPPHGRWQHFEVGGRKRVDELINSWGADVDQLERARRVVDLVMVSVLLDAGAGNKWSYKASNGRMYRRSEGIAVASLEMFSAGLFSSDPATPARVDAKGLLAITTDKLGEALQVKPHNPMSGLEGRAALLSRLSHALGLSPEYFGEEGRPGNLVDYLRNHASTKQGPGANATVLLPTLWTVLLDGLSSIWPVGRTHLEGKTLGDAWPSEALPQVPAHASIVPFHKLTQWLAYSVVQALERLTNLRFAGKELLTGLPEYRNGGLFIDLGVLTLKLPDKERGEDRFRALADAGGQNSEVVPTFDASDDVIVEWRAMTICLLDRVHKDVNRALGLTGANELTLAQVLEAGTWKAGREIAEVQRPNTRGSPIGIVSDGTVF